MRLLGLLWASWHVLAAWVWKMILWPGICLMELMISTLLHCAFGAFIMHCALAKDIMGLLPSLKLGATSAEAPENSPPGTSPRPSYSYLMSCSVLFSVPRTYPFLLASWLRESLAYAGSFSPTSASRLFSAGINQNESQGRKSQWEASSTCLHLDVPSTLPQAERAHQSGCHARQHHHHNHHHSTHQHAHEHHHVARKPVSLWWRRHPKTARDHTGHVDDEPRVCVPEQKTAAGGSKEEAGWTSANGDSRRGSSGADLAPIVLLHGIFGFGHGRLGKLSYFGGIEGQHEGVYVPDLGSLTSIHDRARRLFYYLKGGTVDYGEEHSLISGHSRYGPTLPGQHLVWDEKHPVHLVGHSAGVQVARLLQQMLADQEFEGYNTSADWVASITSLSGALNGTTRVYIDGLSAADGKTMTPVSLLQVLRFGALLYEWLDLPFFKSYYCFGFSHFGLSWRESGFRGLWSSLVLNTTGPFASGDWILPDLSIQSALHLNRNKIRTHPNTYYFSYATRATQDTGIFGRRIVLPAGLSSVHPLFTLRCLQMSLWNYPRSAPKPYAGYKDEEWQHNDGALNAISMMYPITGAPHEDSMRTSASRPNGNAAGLGASTLRNQKRSQGRHRKARKLVQEGDALHPHAPMPTLQRRGSTQTDLACSHQRCQGFPVHHHPVNKRFVPGVWYYSVLVADHILFVISPQRAGVHFDILYHSIFHRCRAVGTKKKSKGAAEQAAVQAEENWAESEGELQQHSPAEGESYAGMSSRVVPLPSLRTSTEAMSSLSSSSSVGVGGVEICSSTSSGSLSEESASGSDASAENKGRTVLEHCGDTLKTWGADRSSEGAWRWREDQKADNAVTLDMASRWYVGECKVDTTRAGEMATTSRAPKSDRAGLQSGVELRCCAAPAIDEARHASNAVDLDAEGSSRVTAAGYSSSESGHSGDGSAGTDRKDKRQRRKRQSARRQNRKQVPMERTIPIGMKSKS